MKHQPTMPSLFEPVKNKEGWEDEWQGMPEFNQNDLQPHATIIVHFHSKEGMEKFSKLVEQPITYKTRSIWFPKAEIGTIADKRYVDSGSKNES